MFDQCDAFIASHNIYPQLFLFVAVPALLISLSDLPKFSGRFEKKNGSHLMNFNDGSQAYWDGSHLMKTRSKR